ncbi:MAG: Mu transposase C-terminal domain-containing protein, partial [Rubrivivax sp.]|nr:Mu transposase C-terminal domain-containing protein [Rubrivivax sp.]
MSASTWLTAAELAALGLPDWPGSEFRSRAKLQALGVPSRVREGRQGGGGREFDTAALPTALRRALLVRQHGLAQQVADTVVPGPSVLTGQVAVCAPTQVAQHQPARTPPSKADSACADARVLLVAHLRGLAHLGMTKAVQQLSDDLHGGFAPQQLLDTAATANQRPRKPGTNGVTISTRTLFRWVGEHRKGGWAALLPAPSQAAPLASLADDVALCLKRYASPAGSSRVLMQVCRDVTAELGRHFDDATVLYGRVRRALPKVDKVQLIKARHRGAERAAKLPFKRRLTEGLHTNDVWVMDGHTFKAKVRHPDHGQPFAPEVTLVLDASDRYIVGWSASLSENVHGVAAAFRHAVTAHGVPGIVYSDNGGGETAKALDCPVVGMYARLGVDHRTGLPGHPQGHGLIERSWQTHMIRAARKFATYQGSDADAKCVRDMRGTIDKERRALERTKSTGEVITLNQRIPSWKQFLDEVAQAVVDYNAQHRHRGLHKHESGPFMGKRRTPAEERMARMVPDEIVRLAEFDARNLALPSVVRKAVRGEVQFLSRFYFNADLMQVDEQQVRVDYDLADANRVWIWTLDGQYVCEALETRQAGSNGMPYFPANALDAARHRRVQAAVKRREAQIDLARRELQPTLPAPAAEFQVPGLQGLNSGRRKSHDDMAFVERVEPTTEQLAPA